MSPALAGRFFTASATWEAYIYTSPRSSLHAWDHRGPFSSLSGSLSVGCHVPVTPHCWGGSLGLQGSRLRAGLGGEGRLFTLWVTGAHSPGLHERFPLVSVASVRSPGTWLALESHSGDKAGANKPGDSPPHWLFFKFSLPFWYACCCLLLESAGSLVFCPQLSL